MQAAKPMGCAASLKRIGLEVNGGGVPGARPAKGGLVIPGFFGPASGDAGFRRAHLTVVACVLGNCRACFMFSRRGAGAHTRELYCPCIIGEYLLCR